MLSCKEATRLLSDARDRELSFRQRWGLRLHVAICSACRAYRRQIALLDDLITARFRGDAEARVPAVASLSPQARQRIREAINRC